MSNYVPVWLKLKKLLLQSETEKWMRLWFLARRENKSILSVLLKHPYRTFIEEMSEGAVTLTKEGIILYCNPKFAEIVQAPYEKVVGSTLKGFITPKDNSN
jgi:PAS domain-containing protein